ncbi:HDIG domain-containing protein [Patescibacteria group bacterium]|nr:HDIG domain-containing protein [Patescibacteria group bacterium]
MRKRLLRFQNIFLVAVLAILLTLFITQPTGAGVRANPGEVAPQTYKAPRTVTYKSDLKTTEAEQKAGDQAPVTYRKDVTAASQQDGKLSATVTAINGLRADPAPLPDRANRLQQVVPNLSTTQAENLLKLSDTEWTQVQAVTGDALKRLQATQVKQDDLTKAEQLISAQVTPNLARPVRDQVVLLGQRLLIPNYVVDNDATEAAKNTAKGAVEPVRYTVERDQVIAYRGQVLSDFDVERLAAVGLTRPDFDWQKTLGIFLLVIVFTSFLILITPTLANRMPRPRRMLAFLSGLAVLVVLVGVLVVPSQPILAYVTPIAATAMLVSIFYGLRAALVAGVCITALFALAAGGSFELFFIHLAASVGIVVFMARVTDTRGFLMAGAVGAGIVFITMTAFSLLAANFDLANVPKFALAAALNGALLATFVFAGAAFLGGPLGTLTFLQLLELESPRRLLLRRLAAEAPGTYSHSVRMATLVESVAKQVGADPLLARVMALYHDIGKLSLPEYFIENQGEAANPHKDLSPKESAELLRAHISEGLVLAREAGVPEAVAAAIPEHHGTTLMAFFWQEARKRSKRAKEEDFRYIGPKPQSKETALVMMADAVEAASRTVPGHDEAKLRTLVRGVFNDRITDGQLNNAPLTARELARMQDAFVATIMTDRHKRIKYPAKETTADARN